LTFKFNLRNIGKYSDYLIECTDSVRQHIIETADCYGCRKACGGVWFYFNGIKYAKCPFDAFGFDDLSAASVENYVQLLDFEINEICGNT